MAASIGLLEVRFFASSFMMIPRVSMVGLSHVGRYREFLDARTLTTFICDAVNTLCWAVQAGKSGETMVFDKALKILNNHRGELMELIQSTR